MNMTIEGAARLRAKTMADVPKMRTKRINVNAHPASMEHTVK